MSYSPIQAPTTNDGDILPFTDIQEFLERVYQLPPPPPPPPPPEEPPPPLHPLEELEGGAKLLAVD
jgi:hypothetical protein